MIDNDQPLTKPEDRPNIFNKYFVNVASGVQFFIKFSKDSFHNYLAPPNINYFLCTLLMKLKSEILLCVSIL